MDQFKKLSIDELKNVKSSLKPKSNNLNTISKPPTAPTSKKTNIKLDINSLKPPPPPPKIKENVDIKSTSVRGQIISELKEMFVKRGLTNRYDL
jgi:hypothetical protein